MDAERLPLTIDQIDPALHHYQNFRRILGAVKIDLTKKPEEILSEHNANPPAGTSKLSPIERNIKSIALAQHIGREITAIGLTPDTDPNSINKRITEVETEALDIGLDVTPDTLLQSMAQGINDFTQKAKDAGVKGANTTERINDLDANKENLGFDPSLTPTPFELVKAAVDLRHDGDVLGLEKGETFDIVRAHVNSYKRMSAHALLTSTGTFSVDTIIEELNSNGSLIGYERFSASGPNEKIKLIEDFRILCVAAGLKDAGTLTIPKLVADLKMSAGVVVGLSGPKAEAIAIINNLIDLQKSARRAGIADPAAKTPEQLALAISRNGEQAGIKNREHKTNSEIARTLGDIREKATRAKYSGSITEEMDKLALAIRTDAASIGVGDAHDKELLYLLESITTVREEAVAAKLLDSLTAPVKKLNEDIKRIKQESEKGGISGASGRSIKDIDTAARIDGSLAGIDDVINIPLEKLANELVNLRDLGVQAGLKDARISTMVAFVDNARSDGEKALVIDARTAKLEVVLNGIAKYRENVKHGGIPKWDTDGIDEINRRIREDGVILGENDPDKPIKDVLRKLMIKRAEGEIVKITDWETIEMEKLNQALTEFMTKAEKGLGINISAMTTVQVVRQIVDDALAIGMVQADIDKTTPTELTKFFVAIREDGTVLEVANSQTDPIVDVKGRIDAIVSGAIAAGIDNATSLSKNELAERIKKEAEEIGKPGLSIELSLEAIRDVRSEAGLINLPDYATRPIKDVNHEITEIKYKAEQVGVTSAMNKTIQDIESELGPLATAAGLTAGDPFLILLDQLTTKGTNKEFSMKLITEDQAGTGNAEVRAALISSFDTAEPQAVLHNLTMVIGGNFEYTAGRRVQVPGILAGERDSIAKAKILIQEMKDFSTNIVTQSSVREDLIRRQNLTPDQVQKYDALLIIRRFLSDPHNLDTSRVSQALRLFDWQGNVTDRRSLETEYMKENSKKYAGANFIGYAKIMDDGYDDALGTHHDGLNELMRKKREKRIEFETLRQKAFEEGQAATMDSDLQSQEQLINTLEAYLRPFASDIPKLTELIKTNGDSDPVIPPRLKMLLVNALKYPLSSQRVDPSEKYLLTVISVLTGKGGKVQGKII